MSDIAAALEQVHRRIAAAERQFGRAPGSVRLLAVSKTRSAADIEAAMEAGQTAFGESYLQEALEKIQALAHRGPQWHFIGPVQANKTKSIARHFDWVHSIDRLKVARRLSEARPDGAGPLDVCIQVNTSGESSKSGVAPQALEGMALELARLPRLRLRGLMTLPAPSDDLSAARRPFRALRESLERLQSAGLAVDTLSMGMTADLEAAIAEGATWVRIGTAIFGARKPQAKTGG